MLTSDPADGLIVSGAYIGISVAINAAMLAFYVFYHPVSSLVSVSRESRILKVTYRMMVCKRTAERCEALDNISECEVLPIRTQYGIVGYVLEIKFKNGARKI